MTRLGVNVDHVATIRQARQAPEPDPVTAALLADLAGADGITVHIRGDRRHIQERDIRLLREQVTTRLNIEMAVTPEMLALSLAIRPETVTLVPERPEEVTTEGGLDLISHAEEVESMTRQLQAARIEVSAFIDPDHEQIEAAAKLGVPLIELNTAAYAEAVPRGLQTADPAFQRALRKLEAAAELGQQRGLRILAGHGLTYRNVGPVSSIPEIEELNIGHNLISRAVLVGLDRAVREMLQAMASSDWS